MKQVLLKHKSGEVLGPYENMHGSINIIPSWICKNGLEALGYTVEDYVKPRRKCEIQTYRP